MNEKLKVVVYCRVSTKDETQNLSFETQKKYYEEYVNNFENWELINIYAEKTSGTKVNRPQFQKMMLQAGVEVIQTEDEFLVRQLKTKPSFDLIIVKDEKRFSRTLDVSPILSALRKKGVGVFFENIGKSTLEVEDILTINMLLSVADNFSKSLSKNLKSSISRNQRLDPHYNLGHKLPFGFDLKKENGRNYLFPKNEIIKNDVIRMFELYAYENYGFRRCANFLSEKGYRSSYDCQMQQSQIERILRNPVYMGCIRVYNHNQQTLQTLGHKKAKYLPEEMVDFVECKDITPIVSKELWYKANEVLKGKDLFNRRGIKTVQNIYSKLLICNCCGNIFVRTNKRNEDVFVCKSKRKVALEDTKRGKYKKIYCRNAYISRAYLDDFFDNQVKDKTFINDFKNRLNAHYEFITFYRYALIETFLEERDYNLISSLKNKILELKNKQDEILDLFDSIPKEVIERKILKIDNEIKEVQKELDNAEFSFSDFKESLKNIDYLLKYIDTFKFDEINSREELFPLIDQVLVSPLNEEGVKPTRNGIELKIISKADTEIEIEIFETLNNIKLNMPEKYNLKWSNQELFNIEEMEKLDLQITELF